MTITIPTTAAAIEAVAFETGAHVELADPASVTVLTEGGVALRLEVAPC